MTAASAGPILQLFFLLILRSRFLLDFMEEACSGILVRPRDKKERKNVESYKNNKVLEIGNLKQDVRRKGETILKTPGGRTNAATL